MTAIEFYNKNLSNKISFETFMVYNEKCRNALQGIRELNFSIDKFSILFSIANISENKFKMLSKMKPNAKYGYISEVLIKCLKKVGTAPLIIKRYRNLKNRYKSIKKNRYYTDEERQIRKDRLKEETLFLVDLCIDEYSMKKIRKNKIEKILNR